MNVIFDLDGTLVNSAPGILGALGYVIKKHGIEGSATLTSDLIGPPLREMLVSLCGTSNQEDLVLIEDTFKSYYDDVGVFQSTVYEGVTQMLDELKARGHKLFIATNKRASPTKSLMKYFSWEKYFMGIYSLDSFPYPIKDKSALLDRIVEAHKLLKVETFYIGDRPEDGDSAKECNLNFIHAIWGFGGNPAPYSEPTAKMPNEVMMYLM